MPAAVLVPVVAVSRYGRARDVGLPAGRIGQGGSAARWMGAVLSVRGRTSRCGPRNRREPGGPVGVCLAGGAVLVLPVPSRAGLPGLGPVACSAGRGGRSGARDGRLARGPPAPAWPAAPCEEPFDRPWSVCCAPDVLAAGVPSRPSDPLLTNPTTPWPASGSAYWCALTEKLGSESPPIVRSTPCANSVTTSTCPLNSTQSPACGW